MLRKSITSGLAAALISLGAAGVAIAGEDARSGTFTGASNHVTKGSVAVVKTDAGYEIRLKGDFWFDDMRVAVEECVAASRRGDYFETFEAL